MSFILPANNMKINQNFSPQEFQSPLKRLARGLSLRRQTNRKRKKVKIGVPKPGPKTAREVDIKYSRNLEDFSAQKSNGVSKESEQQKRSVFSRSWRCCKNTFKKGPQKDLNKDKSFIGDFKKLFIISKCVELLKAKGQEKAKDKKNGKANGRELSISERRRLHFGASVWKYKSLPLPLSFEGSANEPKPDLAAFSTQVSSEADKQSSSDDAFSDDIGNISKTTTPSEITLKDSKSSSTSPPFESLKRLSFALKKLTEVDDHHLLFENGFAVSYEMEKSLEEEVEELISSSHYEPGNPDYDARVEEILLQFNYMFNYLSCSVNSSLRRKTIQMGTEMCAFRDLLIDASRWFKTPSSDMSPEKSKQLKSELTWKSDSIRFDFEDLDMRWNECTQELIKGFEHCKSFHARLTRAYINFYNWHCSVFLTPDEVELFHEYHGAKHFWQSCSNLLKEDLHGFLERSLDELRHGLHFLLEAKAQIVS